MTDDLIEWLRAQLDEDERVARAVEDRSAPWDGQWENDHGHALRTHNGWVLAHNAGQPYAPGLLDHIARHDPARVLAEVDAKRRLLDLHDQSGQRWTGFPRANRQESYCVHDQHTAPCPTVRLMALPSADRPGYRSEWAP